MNVIDYCAKVFLFSIKSKFFVENCQKHPHHFMPDKTTYFTIQLVFVSLPRFCDKRP